MTTGPSARRADPSPLERAVDEGFLIIRASLVVATANQVIRRALQERLPFDEEVATGFVRAEIDRLTEEQLEGARRLRRVRRRTHRSYGQSQHQFDYRVDDVDALRLREATHKALVKELGRAGRDDAFVAAVVDAARARAWDDVGSTVVDRIGWAAAPAPGYDEGRDERLRDLLDIDLAGLAERHDELGGPAGVGPADPTETGEATETGAPTETGA
ncbi:hypothetical protein F1C15_15195 [Frigoribacterium sp. NBH87]|uniref:hypothetical protein n=1 Tax=Frigoribacterium sp. NBH87 TaxID=2596916 RepID=UPI001625D180|nr:hypothetical protein [Frigoribacterium sp. NBH87]QNE44981.1 hypothetical protein F1C15_15195 [Frigoribacterium sp. NBH87]